MKATTLLAITIIIAASPLAAMAEKPLTIKELTICIERDHMLELEEKEMVEELKKVDAMRENLRRLEDSARTLRKRMKLLKAEGKVDEYNALVSEHNALIEEHRKSYADYDAISAAYNAKLEGLAAKRDGFTAQCVSRRFYRMDLMDACEASEYGETPYCRKNKK